MSVILYRTAVPSRAHETEGDFLSPFCSGHLFKPNNGGICQRGHNTSYSSFKMYEQFYLNNSNNNSIWITHFIFVDKYSKQLARCWSPFSAHSISPSFTSSTGLALHFSCHLRRLVWVRQARLSLSFVGKCLRTDSSLFWRERQLASSCHIDYGYKELLFQHRDVSGLIGMSDCCHP